MNKSFSFANIIAFSLAVVLFSIGCKDKSPAGNSEASVVRKKPKNEALQRQLNEAIKFHYPTAHALGCGYTLTTSIDAKFVTITLSNCENLSDDSLTVLGVSNMLVASIHDFFIEHTQLRFLAYWVEIKLDDLNVRFKKKYVSEDLENLIRPMYAGFDFSNHYKNGDIKYCDYLHSLLTNKNFCQVIDSISEINDSTFGKPIEMSPIFISQIEDETIEAYKMFFAFTRNNKVESLILNLVQEQNLWKVIFFQNSFANLNKNYEPIDSLNIDQYLWKPDSLE
jgi:hypothetical protein